MQAFVRKKSKNIVKRAIILISRGILYLCRSVLAASRMSPCGPTDHFGMIFVIPTDETNRIFAGLRLIMPA